MQRKIKKLGLTGMILLGIGRLFRSANATPGVLDTYNKIDSGYISHFHKTIHRHGGTEDCGAYDWGYSQPIIWISDISAKIISQQGDCELQLEAKPEESTSRINLETSLIMKGAQKGAPIAINSPNELRCALPFAESHGYDFGDKTITLQQTDPSSPNVAFPVYDVRKEIAYGPDIGHGYKEFILSLPDLNGVYGSEIPYAFFNLDFDRNLADFNNDKRVDMGDFAILAQEWGKTGKSLADIAISSPDDAVYLSPNTTPYFVSV